LLTFEGHSVRRLHYLAPVIEFLQADMVFMGGIAGLYLPLLRQVRKFSSALPMIVVAPVSETAEWLDALEAGASDYCVPPFDVRDLRSLLAPAEFRRATMAAGAGVH
jgi:DNA-binding response OmpR family regulator